MRSDNQFIIYYGLEIPDPLKTRNLNGGFIVLQDYNPLVAQGLFQEFFPNQQRFLYWNPSKIWVNSNDEQTYYLPKLDFDPHWNTASLDLSKTESRSYVVHKALQLLSLPGVQGLFVDDLDRSSEGRVDHEIMLSIFTEIENKSFSDVHYILNRGFSFWTHVNNISAIFLEGITREFPNFANYEDLKWIQNNLLLRLKLLKAIKPQIPIFGLSYKSWSQGGDFPDEERNKTSEELSSFLSQNLYMSPLLDVWPENLLCNNISL